MPDPDRAHLIGDDIEFRGYVVARRPERMPIGFWEEFVELATQDGSEVERAVEAREKELEEEYGFIADENYERGVRDAEARLAQLKARLKK